MWGWGCAGARVSLNTNTNTSLATTVDTRGWWGLEVELEAGGPYTLTLTQVGPGPVQVHHSSPGQVTAASRAEVVLGGVLAGAVWLCAGADNMALPVAGLANSTAEIEEGLAVAGVRCRGPAPHSASARAAQVHPAAAHARPGAAAGAGAGAGARLEPAEPRHAAAAVRHLLAVRAPAGRPHRPARGSGGGRGQQD